MRANRLAIPAMGEIMIRCRAFLLMIVVGILAGVSAPSAQTPATPLLQDEQALKAAGIATDGPALLDYFRQRTPSAEKQAALKQRAAQLGSSVYAVRIKATDELIRAGRAALPFL